MSKFILSNKKAVVDKFIQHCSKVGFDRYQTVYATEGVCGCFFEKRCMTNNNYLSDGNNWVATIGTCFYREKIGKEGLELLLADTPKRTISELRSDMKGNFAVLICQDSKITIFTDEQGIFTTFYYLNNRTGEWIISSSLYEMAKVSDSDVKLNEFNVLEQVYAFQIFGNGTVFEGFNKLLGREYISLDLSASKFKIERWPCFKPFVVDERDVSVVASEASDLLKKTATIVHDNFKDNEIALCVTGGLDSRMILSSFLVTGTKPVLYYGTGNSILTNTHQEDLDVNKMYATKYGLTTKMMDWRTPEHIDEGWDTYIDRYGMSASVYSSSPMLMNSFESVTEKIIFLGMFGEIFRNEAIAEHNSGKELSLDDIIDAFYFDGDVKTVIGDPEKYHAFRDSLKKKFKEYLNPYLNNDGKLPIDNFCFFANEMMTKGHVSMVNYLNQQRYCFSMLADPDLVKKTFVPVSQRDDAKFIIRVLCSLFPEILEIPIYSRNAWRVFNKENNEVELLSKGLLSKARGYLSSTPFGKQLKAMIRPFLRKMDAKSNPRNTITHHDIANYLQPIIDANQIFNHHIKVVGSEYLSKESRYAILLRTFKKVNNDK